jgi:methionine sulfoxide reductase heme-binding subunit
VTLWFGPWNVLRRRPNPVSFDLRRDVGIWAGILAIFHTLIGLTVHLRGRMWMYFLKRIHPIQLENNEFGFANYAGLGAALLFLMVLAISNDASLRTLKTSRWKSLQRGTYAAFVLTAAHGIAYQSVEKRHTPWVLIFSGTVTVVLLVQTLGFYQVNWGEPKRRAMRDRQLNLDR